MATLKYYRQPGEYLVVFRCHVPAQTLRRDKQARMPMPTTFCNIIDYGFLK